MHQAENIGGGQSSDSAKELPRSGKTFFELMRDYMEEVDTMLR